MQITLEIAGRHRARSLTRTGPMRLRPLRRLLAFETRRQVDAFLKEREVYDFTAADFEQDRETLHQLREREAHRALEMAVIADRSRF